MASPRTPLVIDALVEQFATVLAGRVVVVDGDDASWSAKSKDALFVGTDDPEDGEAPRSGRSEHDWRGVGPLGKDEDGEVFCVIAVGRGSGTLKVVRDLAYGYLADVEQYLREQVPTSPWLGVPGLQYGGVSETSHTQGLTQDGPLIYLHFTVAYRART